MSKALVNNKVKNNNKCWAFIFASESSDLQGDTFSILSLQT